MFWKSIGINDKIILRKINQTTYMLFWSKKVKYKIW